MKKIVFFGAVDKSHVLLVLGRLLTELNRKVLLVDSTTAQTIQGYLPHIVHGSAVQEFEGMDVAYGYINATQLERELMQPIAEADYDIMLLDTDHTQFVAGGELSDFEKRVWCWDGKKSSLLRNEDLLLRLCVHEVATPLTFYRMISPVLHNPLPEWKADMRMRDLRWEETAFRFPLDERDVAVDLENQHHGRIQLRGLSWAYRQNLLKMLEQLGDCDRKAARRAWSHARKRVRIW